MRRNGSFLGDIVADDSPRSPRTMSALSALAGSVVALGVATKLDSSRPIPAGPGDSQNYAAPAPARSGMAVPSSAVGIVCANDACRWRRVNAYTIYS